MKTLRETDEHSEHKSINCQSNFTNAGVSTDKDLKKSSVESDQQKKIVGFEKETIKDINALRSVSVNYLVSKQ